MFKNPLAIYPILIHFLTVKKVNYEKLVYFLYNQTVYFGGMGILFLLFGCGFFFDKSPM